MNKLLASPPFDLYELTLFQFVADTGSFTRAAERAGLTQSAITRQIHGMEERLGALLFERTTRHVALTRAGRLLQEKVMPLLKATDELFRELQQTFNRLPPTLRVGVARSIGLAYLPGYFFAFHRQHPEVQLQVVQRTSREIVEALDSGHLDAGLVCPPQHLPRSLQVTHRFADEFVAIVPPQLSPPSDPEPLQELKKHLSGQRWLMIERESYTGQRLYPWLNQQGWQIEPAMELDSFDVIVNLVSLGLGVSLVPHRVLPLYEQRRAVRRVRTQPRFSRDLAVAVRRNRVTPEPLRSFIENILF
ncbi:MAG TPA: LysR family transcriptional regulator [Terriglobia bacterium]|nr:LysR family transcriptional regulator [Terriglobia bacterium]